MTGRFLRACGLAVLVIAASIVAAQPATAVSPNVDGVFFVADPEAKRFATAETSATDRSIPMLPFGWPGQTWQISNPKGDGNHEIRNTLTNGCWAVHRITIGPGSPLQHLPCTGTSEQQWEIQTVSIDGTVRIISAHSGRCAGVALAEPGNRPILRELDCTGGANQKFVLLRP